MRAFNIILISGVSLVVFATGFMCFLLPFDAVTTGTHVAFAILMVLVTLWHLIERRKALTRYLFQPTVKKEGGRAWLRYSALLFIGLALGLCLSESGVVRALSALSYEGRHKNSIFRARPDVVYQQVGDELSVLKQGELGLSLEVDLKQADRDDETLIVIWAEDSRGNLIETLFLSESLCFQDHYQFAGHQLSRTEILPIWSHKRNGKIIDGDGNEVDAISSATIVFSLSLNTVLKDELNGFHIKMEVNRLGDENEVFNPAGELELLRPKPGLGQPSVLYSAYLDLHDEHLDTYFLLKYEGHGAPMGDDGFVTFGHEGLSTARRMVAKALLGVTFPKSIKRDSKKALGVET